jgi:uncharacterized membrane protein
MAAMRPRPRLRDVLRALAGLCGALYPFLVYFALPHMPPAAVVAIALGLGGVQVFRRRLGTILPFWGLLVIPALMLALLAVRPMLAAQAYPTLVSLCLAAAFAWSLARPPSMIERVARLRTPDLPPAGVAYTRSVTKVWLGFFLANAAIATVCAVWGSVAIWTLWTGLLSYLLIGAMIGGEMLVRHGRLPRAAR